MLLRGAARLRGTRPDVSICVYGYVRTRYILISSPHAIGYMSRVLRALYVSIQNYFKYSKLVMDMMTCDIYAL